MGILTKSMRKQQSARMTLFGMPIHSKFVTRTLQNTAWEDRQKVLDLIHVEQRILDRAEGLPDKADGEALCARYPQESRTIESELLSAEHFELRKRRRNPAEKALQENRRALDIQRSRTEEEYRQEWITLGGKP